VFELGEELLDRVQIGRVFRQVEEPGAGGTDVEKENFAAALSKLTKIHAAK
jgi:hypothetical protein